MRQQVGGKPGALRRDVEEERFHRRVRRLLGDVPESSLGVLAGLDQMVQYGTFASISHGLLLTSYSVATRDVSASGTKSTTIPA